MMTPYLDLAVFVYLIAASYVAHEYGHAFVAKALGCKLMGWYFKLPWAAGYMFDLNGRSIRVPAAGGLFVTACLAGFGALLMPHWIGATLLYWNAILFLFNAIPIRLGKGATDGYYLLFGWRPRAN